jgi:CHAD domain-containing protein
MRYDLRDPHSPPRKTVPAPRTLGAIRREPIVLDPSMNIMEAFAAVTRGCIDHITTAAAVARTSEGPEGIHQLRVGIRRLRAAFSVFGPALPSPRPRVVTRLRTLQQRLGAAREMDVLLAETLASMPGKLQNRRGMREFVRRAQASRIACNRRTRAALASRRCAVLLAQLGPAIDRYTRRPRNGPAGARMNEPIAAFAAEVLRSRDRKARKLGDRIGGLRPDQLHELRIRIKKLRYAAEFFRDLVPGQQAERYLRALKDLQQVLGTPYDAVVAPSLIARIGKRGEPETICAARAVQDWAKACFNRAEGKLDRLWRRFANYQCPCDTVQGPQRNARTPTPYGRWIALY